MDPAPGRIGFMSSERWEDHSSPATKTCRREVWNHRYRGSCKAGAAAEELESPLARLTLVDAGRGTAPPDDTAWLATISLASDCRIVKLVRPVPRFSSPPSLRARFVAETGTHAPAGSSHAFIPVLSGSFGFPSSLPQIPAGRRRWAERYDGKRNLHLQHAA